MTVTLTETVRQMHKLRAELDAHEAAEKDRSETLKREIRAKALILENATEGLDAEKIATAQSVLRVYGSFERGGADRVGVIADAIKQIATGEPVRPIYGDLWRVQFGTKNYDRWHGQRSDHEYGYGPKHGITVFSVGFTDAVRKRDPQALTPEEVEAAIYYLTNIQRVQQAAARASAA
jgi:hypothetical protein